MLRIPEFLISLAIAYGFVCLGEATLQRPSRSLVEWNQAFLVGVSIAATALFPLSLLLPGHALLALASLVLGTALLHFSRRRLTFSFTTIVQAIRESENWNDPLSRILLVLISLLVLQFVVQNLRLSYLWDGYQIWATKALALYDRGGLTKDFLVPGQPDRLAEYPPMVPLYEALVSLVRGSFEWNSLKPVFAPFYVSMLVSTYDAGGALLSKRLALAATALLALLPAVSTRFNVGGYADMPQATLVAGALAALLCHSEPKTTGFRSSPGWVLVGLLLVKNEGIVLLSIVCFIVGGVWLLSGRTRFLEQCRKYWQVMGIIFLGVLLRRLYVAWVNANDLTYGPIDKAHLVRAGKLIVEVPMLCLHHMLNVSEWGLFWPAFVLSVPILLLAGTRVQKSLAVGATLAIAAYASVFYFTNWDVPLHIDQAYSRLLTQIAPAASIAVVAAYARMSGRVDGSAIAEHRGFR